MKNLLTTLLLLVGLSAFGQGTAIRSLNGIGTNVNLKSTTTLKNAAETATITLVPSLNGASSRLTINGVPVAADVIIEDSVITADRFIGVTTPGFVGYHTGNGAGLTNLIGATNFSSSVTYNFNGKTTFNAVSYNTNAWAGPTNPIVLTTNYQFFVASTDCDITGISGQLSDQNTWATLTVSNSTASPITVRSTATGFRLQGSASTAALVIGAGKEGYLSFHSRGTLSTNVVTTTQQ